MWLENQIFFLKKIDDSWVEIENNVRILAHQKKGFEENKVLSWFHVLNCVWNDLKAQQNWQSKDRLKKYACSLFGKYSEILFKNPVPCFSPIWHEEYVEWPNASKTVCCKTIFGFDLNTAGFDMWDVLTTGHYRQETYESILILRLLPEVKLFLDVGANIGYYSLMVHFASGKNVKTIAFEPSRRVRKTFLDSLISNKCEKEIKIMPVAIGSKVGVADLHISALGSGNNSIEPADASFITNQIERVRVTTLDDVQKNFASDYPPTLIKIDVEGFEREVLEGGNLWLSHKNAPIILIEAWPKTAKSRSNHIENIKKLNSFGYKVYPILKPSVSNFPLGKKCKIFNYKSITGNYLALPPHKSYLYSMLKKSVDIRVFTKPEYLQKMANFLKNSLISVKSGNI